MIQRIQSIYLLVVTGLLIAALCLPIGTFIEPGINVWKSIGLTLEGDGGFRYTWGLFCILMLATVVAFATIFLFKNRMLQIRMTVFNSLLLVGYYAVLGVFYWTLKDMFVAFNMHFAICFPMVAIILNYLAIRAIGRDEVMVRAADRLR